MSQFYCQTCGRYRDSNDEDMAEYEPEIICGDCVYETRRFETRASGETIPKAKGVGAQGVVAESHKPIFEGLGRF